MGNGQPNSFITGRIVDAGGETEGEPVGVADAVETGVTTVTEQAVVVLAHGGGVVNTYVVLILVGDIEVLELGLQGLAGALAKPILLAIEGEAALETNRG
ncbi:hypothetical protein D3C84_341730 [compost metagenome]